ncbi:MAG: LytTR family DNA-binding domain-containing protein [Asticcacaulis sp.]
MLGTAARLIGADWLRTYMIAAGMAVLLCFTGANHTDVLPVAARLGYWLILMIAGTAVAQTCSLWLDRWALPVVQEIAALTAIIIPPITVLVWLVSALFVERVPQPRLLPYYIPPVALISLAMAILHAFANRQPLQSHAHLAAADSPGSLTASAGEALRERLEFRYRQADIHAISAEDHYLRIHTSAGQTLVLMRLYDAIALLDGIEGSQVHRSWWVAKDAVADVAKSDGRIDLVLKGGTRVPVSRRYQKALKSEGWV